MIAGLIYNPANDELYIAERGKGAFLNDQRLRVAGRRKLDDCVIACGLPHIGRGDHDLSRREMTEIQNRVAGLRRFGAASLDMAFVAAGRLDGYWERNLSALGHGGRRDHRSRSRRHRQLRRRRKRSAQDRSCDLRQ